MKRRSFLGESACAALGSTSILSTLLNLNLASKASADALDPNGEDCKTLICLFLHGGIDSFNLLVPRDDARHQTYATSRTNLALKKSSLRALDQEGGDSQSYGLHSSTPELAELFNGIGGNQSKRRLSFVSNVGTLIEPASVLAFQNESVRIPKALFSHIDQIEQWQTSVPQGMDQLSGWGGRAADVLHSSRNTEQSSMAFSFAKKNIFQIGTSTSQFTMNSDGTVSLSSWSKDPIHVSNLKNAATRSLIDQQYQNLLESSFAKITKNALEQQSFVQERLQTINTGVDQISFPGDSLGKQLKTALKTIALREELGLRRQTIFLSYGGWDHHNELLGNQAGMLPSLSKGLMALQKGIDGLGLTDSVLTFTASDFGRTLRSNGRGTDHAWGGNQLVMGGPVAGGKVLGTFPDLTLDGPDDVGRGGRILPTTSVDELFCELLLWFGLPKSSFDYVLPNLENFYDVTKAQANHTSSLPLGLLKPGQF